METRSINLQKKTRPKSSHLQKAFETAARINEELKSTSFDRMHFTRKIKLLMDRFSSFFAKRIKPVEKVIHQKEK